VESAAIFDYSRRSMSEPTPAGSDQSPSAAVMPPISAAPERPGSGPLADVDVRPHVRRDPLLRKVARRAINMPAHFVFTALWWSVAPLVLPILIVADLARRRPLVWTRFYVMLGAILFGQSWGLLLLFTVWIATGFGLAWRRFNRWAFAAESYWAQWNVRWMARIYRITYDFQGIDVLRDGPTILLMRHASINDTILPIGFAAPVGVRLRIVLKAELLWVPIVDAIAHCVPFGFIRRSSGDASRELAAIRAITPDLHPQESIMIFPEGTRFSEARRAQIIERLREKDPAAAAAAAALTHVLPFRLGGTQALLDGAPHADLVFCAHTGYENSARLADFVAGGLYRATVKVRCWRVAARDVPSEPAARAAFFDREWQKVNDWVAANQASRLRN
jgi:1-acyl-sn-glycerol-3-phosphate acyltransferase